MEGLLVNMAYMAAFAAERLILTAEKYFPDGNEIARLLLLYSDRCGYSQTNYEELFRVLRGMEGGLGVITEDVLKDFYMKK